MKRLYIVLMLVGLFGLSLVSVSAADTDVEVDGASGKCKQINVDYHPFGGLGDFTLNWTLSMGATLIEAGSFTSPRMTGDFGVIKLLTLSKTLAAGTYTIVFEGEDDGDDDSQTFTVPDCVETADSSAPVELPPCEISDDRLDEGCSNFVVAYSQMREDGCYINVYSPYGRADGKTVLLLQVTPAEIAAAQAEGGNVVIDSTDVVNLTAVTVYWLPKTGEFQVNAGPNEEGKVYVLNFTGCPATNIYTTNSYQGAN